MLQRRAAINHCHHSLWSDQGSVMFSQQCHVTITITFLLSCSPWGCVWSPPGPAAPSSVNLYQTDIDKHYYYHITGAGPKYSPECLPCCLLKIHKYASPCSSPGPLETSDTGLTVPWGPSDCAWGRWAPSPSCSGSWWSRLRSHGHSVAIIWVFVRACGLQLPPEQPLVLPAGVQPRLQRHHVLQLVISRQSVATGGTAVSGVTTGCPISQTSLSFC